jgi:hypothetical protein
MKLVSERGRIERAEPTKAERKTQIKAWIELKALRAGPYMRWQDGKPIIAFSTYVEGARTAEPDLAAIMAWLDPVAFEKKLMKMIDAMPEPSFSINGEDKAQRLKEISREMKNQIIPRRAVADPRAVLGLSVKGTWRATTKAVA